MKRVFSPLLLSSLAAVLLAACSTVDDTQVTRQGPSIGFVNLTEEQTVPPGHQFQVFASSDGGLSALSVRLDDQAAQDLPLQGSNTVTLPTDLSDGEHQLVATVTDDRNVSRSATRKFSVDASLAAPGGGGDVVDPGDDDTPPTGGDDDDDDVAPSGVRVSLISPTAESVVRGDVDVVFEVAARDTTVDGILVEVNGTQLPTDPEATGTVDHDGVTRTTYSVPWDSRLLRDGSATVVVTVETAEQVLGTAEVAVVAQNDPVVEWLSHTDYEHHAGVLPLKAGAEGERGLVRWRYLVESANGRTLVAEGTGSIDDADDVSWDARTAQPGTYTLIAEVTDEGDYVASSTVEIELGSIVTIDLPTEGESVGPGGVKVITAGLHGTFPEGESVTAVDVLFNGKADPTREMNVQESSTGKVFVYEWFPAESSEGHDVGIGGDRLITLRAEFEDGTTVFSPGVLVHYALPDAPEVTFHYPVDGATVGGEINLLALVEGGVGQANVEYVVNGVPLSTSTLDTTTFADGTELVLLAIATDEAGRRGQAVVTVTVDNS